MVPIVTAMMLQFSTAVLVLVVRRVSALGDIGAGCRPKGTPRTGILSATDGLRYSTPVVVGAAGRGIEAFGVLEVYGRVHEWQEAHEAGVVLETLAREVGRVVRGGEVRQCGRGRVEYVNGLYCAERLVGGGADRGHEEVLWGNV